MVRVILLCCLLFLAESAVFAAGHTHVTHDGATVTFKQTGSPSSTIAMSVTTAGTNEVAVMSVASPAGDTIVSFDGVAVGFPGWSFVSINDDGRCCVSVWQALIPAAGTYTFTAHIRSAAQGCCATMDVYPGVDPVAAVDGFENIDVGSVGSLWSGDIVVAADGDIVVTYVASSDNGIGFTAGTGYSLLATIKSSSLQLTEEMAIAEPSAGADIVILEGLTGNPSEHDGSMVAVVLHPKSL